MIHVSETRWWMESIKQYAGMWTTVSWATEIKGWTTGSSSDSRKSTKASSRMVPDRWQGAVERFTITLVWTLITNRKVCVTSPCLRGSKRSLKSLKSWNTVPKGPRQVQHPPIFHCEGWLPQTQQEDYCWFTQGGSKKNITHQACQTRLWYVAFVLDHKGQASRQGRLVQSGSPGKVF